MFFKTGLVLIGCLLALSFPHFMGNGNLNYSISLKTNNASDTVYSGQIHVYTSILTFPLPNASVKFSIIDTINQIKQLITEGVTDQNGALIIERLPIISNFVGINDLSGFIIDENQLIISNNGTASDHSILIKTKQKIAKQGFIIDINGRLIEPVRLNFNPVLQAYEGNWRGSAFKSGTYVFYTETTNGPIAEKINHVSGLPGENSQAIPHNFSSFPEKKLKESALINSKYEIEVNSEVSEPFKKYVYIYEQSTQDFDFTIEHLPISDARINGVVTINQTILASNAVMSWKSLLSDEEFYTYTDANGLYHKDDVPVTIDNQFTHPEWDRYYLSINIGDSITFKVDPVTVISGELVTKNCNINIL